MKPKDQFELYCCFLVKEVYGSFSYQKLQRLTEKHIFIMNCTLSLTEVL